MPRSSTASSSLSSLSASGSSSPFASAFAAFFAASSTHRSRSSGASYRLFSRSQLDSARPAVAMRPAMPSGTAMPAKNCPHSHDVGDPRVAYTDVQDVHMSALPTMVASVMTADIAYRSWGAVQPLRGGLPGRRDSIRSPVSSRSVMLMS